MCKIMRTSEVLACKFGDKLSMFEFEFEFEFEFKLNLLER